MRQNRDNLGREKTGKYRKGVGYDRGNEKIIGNDCAKQQNRIFLEARAYLRRAVFPTLGVSRAFTILSITMAVRRKKYFLIHFYEKSKKFF